MLPVMTVRVVGPSMEPTLRNGEWWLARRGGRIDVGDVVLLTHPARPDLRVVKRVVRRAGNAWWVEGDAPGASEDSRTFGPVADELVMARLLMRYRPLPLRRISRRGG
jgi:nickel-type superoxide dismutase maturation protease